MPEIVENSSPFLSGLLSYNSVRHASVPGGSSVVATCESYARRLVGTAPRPCVCLERGIFDPRVSFLSRVLLTTLTKSADVQADGRTTPGRERASIEENHGEQSSSAASPG